MIRPLGQRSEFNDRNVLGLVPSVVDCCGNETAFSVCSVENILRGIRVTEDASGTPMIGSLNVDDGDKSSDHGSVKTKEKRIWKCDATSEVVLRPEGVLVGLANPSRGRLHSLLCWFLSRTILAPSNATSCGYWRVLFPCGTPHPPQILSNGLHQFS